MVHISWCFFDLLFINELALDTRINTIGSKIRERERIGEHTRFHLAGQVTTHLFVLVYFLVARSSNGFSCL
jgi:hypothetical protein